MQHYLYPLLFLALLLPAAGTWAGPSAAKASLSVPF